MKKNMTTKTRPSNDQGLMIFERQLHLEIRTVMLEIESKIEWLEEFCKDRIYWTDSITGIWLLVNLKARLSALSEQLDREGEIGLKLEDFCRRGINERVDDLSWMREEIEAAMNHS
jgi:hypothetical protein